MSDFFIHKNALRIKGYQYCWTSRLFVKQKITVFVIKKTLCNTDLYKLKNGEIRDIKFLFTASQIQFFTCTPDSSPVVCLHKTLETRVGDRRGTRGARPKGMMDESTCTPFSTVLSVGSFLTSFRDTIFCHLKEIYIRFPPLLRQSHKYFKFLSTSTV